MSRNRVISTLVIHACPGSQTAEVEQALKIYCEKVFWKSQQLLVGASKSTLNLKLTNVEACEIMSKLNQMPGLVAELVQKLQIIMLVPGLGLYRADTNEAGEIVLSEDRIRQVLEVSVGNFREVQRQFRVLLGQAWDDVLEPYRAANHGDNLVLLNPAV